MGDGPLEDTGSHVSASLPTWTSCNGRSLRRVGRSRSDTW